MPLVFGCLRERGRVGGVLATLADPGRSGGARLRIAPDQRLPELRVDRLVRAFRNRCGVGVALPARGRHLGPAFGLVHGAQPRCQRDEHVLGEPRVLPELAEEIPPVEHHAERLLDREDGGRPRAPVEERQLAEELTRPELGEQPAVAAVGRPDAHLDRALDEEEHAVRLLVEVGALLDDLVALRVRRHAGQPGQPGDRIVGQAFEQPGAAEQSRLVDLPFADDRLAAHHASP